MRLSEIADSLLGGVEEAAARVTAWTEPTLRLGVTGLSGAGKTVFITALVASLLSRGRLHQFAPEAQGRILAATLGHQPDPGVARFAYEAHVAALTGATPHWPESTRSVSQIRVSLRYRPTGMLAGLRGTGVLHLDIVDYPGEWLVDLTLMERDYDDWSREALALAALPGRAAQAAGWARALAAAEPAAAHSETAAEALAAAWAGYLGACREAGLAALAPGRFLMPGEMAGSPALTFAPLPRPEGPAGRESLFAQMRARYDAYRRLVVRPFFRDHFAGLDRQVVLVDTLGALAAGPRALGDLTAGMAGTLAAFRHGASGWLDRLIGAHRIDRLLFVASKADHLHHSQHGALTRLTQAMLAEAAARAAFRGAEIRAMALAAVRATSEQETESRGRRLELVRGRRLADGREVAVFPGTLPEDPRPLMAAALAGAGTPADWPAGEFAAIRFAPPRWGGRAEDGPPHIRLDRAIDFLLGDRLE